MTTAIETDYQGTRDVKGIMYELGRVSSLQLTQTQGGHTDLSRTKQGGITGMKENMGKGRKFRQTKKAGGI
jgi:hypothetical protein